MLRKSAYILINIFESQHCRRGVFASKLRKEVGMSNGHATKIIRILKDLNLIYYQKEGRLNMLALTPRGFKVAKNLFMVKNNIC